MRDDAITSSAGDLAAERHRQDDPDSIMEAKALDAWRTSGRERVREHWHELTDLVQSAEQLVARGKYCEAAIAAQIAANHAVLWHAGVFVHPELERLLRKLGEVAIPCEGHGERPVSVAPGLAVLHVATELGDVGGHMRMMARWVLHDAHNVHSLALTRQHGPVPQMLRGAITAGQGKIHQLNLTRGGLLGWAQALQAAISQADLVVLHVHSMDVIPMLALAGLKNRPQTVLLNHADHLFWLGADFVDHVINTRNSGLRLNIERRGIAAERNLLLPLCLEPQTRQQSREQAKQQLNLPQNSIVLLTIARPLKFRAVGGLTFADTLVPVLKQDTRIRLIVVGPGGHVDWAAAESEVPDQIRVVRQTANTKAFLEAADIYVDSFPFVSITSLFEAGLYGLPLVTRNPFGEGCAIMGADSPGIDGVIQSACDINEFREILLRLIRDGELREEIGARTKARIETINTGHRWKQAVARMYEQLLSAPPIPHISPREPGPHMGDPDALLPSVYGNAVRGATPASRLAADIELVVKIAPLGWRLRILAKYLHQRQLHLFETPAWRLLIPEWLGARIRLFVPRDTGGFRRIAIAGKSAAQSVAARTRAQARGARP